MFRINKISIRNFRSYYDEHEIDLGERGKNLLVYGENGSGKSSLCKALSIFFNSTDQRRRSTHKIELFENIFLEEPQKGKSFIKLKIKEQIHPNSKPKHIEVVYNSSGHTKQNYHLGILNNARRCLGSLDYKALLRTYLIETKELNLFFLLIHGPFYNIKNPVNPKRLFGPNFEDIKRQKKTIKKDDELLSEFNLGLKSVLEEITEEVNNILSYFPYGIKVNFLFKGLYITQKKNFGGNSIKLKLTQQGRLIRDHHDFFNEAKLSALGIAIYLASFLYKTMDEEYSKALKILLLDDIFIGMDNSNRIPVIKLLNEKFKGYQIILTTYDSYWFNLVKSYLGNNWTSAKIYIHENKGIQTSMVLQESDSYLDKARKHFNLKDYPACANYQRKACERLIKEFLPENLRLNANTKNGSIIEDTNLQSLFNKLIKYLEKNEMDITPFKDFNIYKKVVNNPLSHDDLKSSVYRIELEQVFQLIASFHNLENKIVLKSGERLILKLTNSKKKHRIYHLELKGNLRKLIQKNNSTKLIEKFARFECKPLFYREDEQEFSLYRFESENVEKIYQKICYSFAVKKGDKSSKSLCYNDLGVSENPLEEIETEGGKTLQQILIEE